MEYDRASSLKVFRILYAELTFLLKMFFYCPLIFSTLFFLKSMVKNGAMTAS